MKTYILYHANCSDGFGAALAAWQHFKDTATYVPVKYSELPPDIPDGSDIFIVDFSYPRNVLLEMLGKNHQQKSITVIDHHKTAQQDLEGWDYPNTRIIFDMNESGATLTWRFFENIYDPHAYTPPSLYQYLRDRDLWKWELPSSKEISAAIASHPKNFELWATWLDDRQMVRLAKDGEAILRYQNKMIDSLCQNARLHEFDRYSVLTVNTPYFGSEIGNKLCADSPHISCAICYSKQADGRWRYELRSVGEFDVGELAKKHGGGGHKNAAGFIQNELIFR